MARNVYALYFLDPSGVKRYFYVGRSNDVPRRISEHIRLTAGATKTNTSGYANSIKPASRGQSKSSEKFRTASIRTTTNGGSSSS